MNMFSTGNPEEDELLRLLRQGLITPEQLEDMSAGQQAAQELRGGVSDTLIPMGSRRDTTVRAAASLQPETTAMAQAPAQRASTPMASRSEGMKERSLTDMLKDRASTAAPMLDQRREEDAQPRFVNTFKPRGYLPEEKAELSIRERPLKEQFATEKAKQLESSLADPKIAALNATPVERGLLPGERAEEKETDESFDPSLGRYEEMPIVMEETIVTPDDEDAGEDQQSLLSRIGGLIANNPEAVASGAQLLGGLVSNAAQNRAQRRADRTTDQRVARANLISAITGGRARPTVERAQADTGGLLSLDTLGKALQGGGAAVKGELARRDAEDERERKADLEKRALDIKDFQAQSLDDFRKGKIEAETGSADLSAVERRQVKELAGSIDVLDQFIKDFDNLEGEEDSYNRMFRGLSTNVPIFGAAFSPKAQKFTDQRSILVGQVAKIINGGASGQISDFEQKLANEAVPDIRKMRDSGAYGRSKLTALKDLFDLRRQAMLRGIDEPLHKLNAFYEITGAERKEGDEGAAEYTVDDFTADEVSIVSQALAGDEDAKRQVMNNPRLRAYMGE